MAKLRIQGDTSGYIDIAAPATADNSTLDLGQVPQKNQTNVFTGDLGVGTTPLTAAHIVTGGSALTLSRVASDDGAAAPALKLMNDSTKTRLYSYGTSLDVHTGAVGSTPVRRMRIDDDGYITTPYQVFFSAYNTADYAMNSLSTYKITWNATNNNRGNHYSTSTGRFTAPVSGVYYFSWGGIIEGSGTSNFRMISYLYINGTESHNKGSFTQWQVAHSSHDDSTAMSTALVYLTAGDYVETYMRHEGTTNGNLWGGDARWAGFTGYLLG